MPTTITRYIDHYEVPNVLTHGFGALLCLIAVPILLWQASFTVDHQQLFGLSVFGGSMFLVYLSSTLYHSARRPRLKYNLQVLDHISIYFLIAGTHTPFLLYYLNNATGWFYLAVLWGMVLVGTLYKLFFFGKLPWFSLIFYIGMGWMAIFTIPHMLDNMSFDCLWWIIAGGISYSVGVIFYQWRKLPYSHAIWHLFVIGGSAGHYLAMLEMVR